MPNPFAPRHKFKVAPAEERTRHGVTFDSKLEMAYYDHLCERVASGAIVFFLRQVAFHLPGKTRYVCDFQEFHADGTVHFVDVKGMETDQFRLKKRQVEDLYPIVIEIVKAADLKRMKKTWMTESHDTSDPW